MSTQRHALQTIGELEALRRGSAEQQLLAWYYMLFGLGFCHTVKRQGRPQTTKGWMSPSLLGHHLGLDGGSPHVIAVAPATITSWAVVDIDAGSRYHPGTDGGEGDEPVRMALATLGLVEPLEVQSSRSTGLHLWYPLAEVVNTWVLAVAMRSACAAARLELRPGVLELRPNMKSRDADYLTIRAPLTGEGNALWVPGLDLCDDLAVLRYFWRRAQVHNRLLPAPSEVPDTSRCPVTGRSSNRLCGSSPPPYPSPLNRRGPEEPARSLQSYSQRLKLGFTGKHQTDELKFAALLVAGVLEGLTDPEKIRRRCVTLVSEAPGFEEFCSHKCEIRLGRAWSQASRMKAASATPGGYEGTWKQRANLKRAQSASLRAQSALETARAGNCRYRSERSAIQDLRARGAPARSWWMKPENRRHLEHLRELVSASRTRT